MPPLRMADNRAESTSGHCIHLWRGLLRLFQLVFMAVASVPGSGQPSLMLLNDENIQKLHIPHSPSHQPRGSAQHSAVCGTVQASPTLIQLGSQNFWIKLQAVLWRPKLNKHPINALLKKCLARSIWVCFFIFFSSLLRNIAASGGDFDEASLQPCFQDKSVKETRSARSQDGQKERENERGKKRGYKKTLSKRVLGL